MPVSRIGRVECRNTSVKCFRQSALPPQANSVRGWDQETTAEIVLSCIATVRHFRGND